MPAIRGGWRRTVPADQRVYLPLTPQVLTEHLSGDAEVGLYPMLDGDRCHWLAADFDGDAAITVMAKDLPPALMATLKHAATMPNPVFYERQRRRASTWDTPRFLCLFDETAVGDLILPRGLLDRLHQLIE